VASVGVQNEGELLSGANVVQQRDEWRNAIARNYGFLPNSLTGNKC
jgi:hypothetical protein